MGLLSHLISFRSTIAPHCRKRMETQSLESLAPSQTSDKQQHQELSTGYVSTDFLL